MADRGIDDVVVGMDAATEEEPFMLTRSELVAHLEAKGATGCGGYSTISSYEGERVVAWDYACKD